MKTFYVPALCAAGFACASFSAVAAEVAYISSSSGYVLHKNGNVAMTANWLGQAPISGFTGYGQIKISGSCLTGKAGSQPLTWEGCRAGDKSQIWALSGKKLNNEGGWCADVEGNRPGAGVRVMAWKCSGAGNQQWSGHYIQPAQVAANRISDPKVRAKFLQSAKSAPAGAVISTTTGNLVASGAGNLVASGAGNLVAAGAGNLVASGAGN